MKNKTTYEMDDIMGLITRDLAEKGLAPDHGTIVVRTRDVVGGLHGCPVEVEIDVNVSWVGPATSGLARAPERATAQDLSRPEPAASMPVAPRDLLEEAPEPGTRPAIDLTNVTATSQEISRAGPGLFAPDKVKRRLTGLDGESTEYPGSSRTGGR